LSALIRSENLDVGYDGKVVVNNVNVSGEKGEMICLLGPNGSGKTTILRTLTALQPPVKGQVFLDGVDISKIPKPELAKKLAVVLTEKVSLGLMTVFEIASMGRYPHTGLTGKITKSEIDIVDEALSLVKAGHLKNRYYFELSDGEKQKIMIARALVQEPQLIVLDEPTSHLDVSHKVEVVSILKRLCQEKGITVILSLHDIDIAIKGCQTILLIEKGEVKAQGSPEEVICEGTIQNLYQIKGAKYNELLGCLEFSAPKESQVFITGGDGTGTGVYRALSRAGYGICCGILHSNDVDVHVAKSLSCEIIEENSFVGISQKQFEQALCRVEAIDYLVDTGFPVAKGNEMNLELVKEAIRKGKKVLTLFDETHLKDRYGELFDRVIPCHSTMEMVKWISENKRKCAGL
jgi:iron complex transport system ATP-binding protein